MTVSADSIGANELGSIAWTAVECNGECTDVTLGQVCDTAGTNWRPFAISTPQYLTYSASQRVDCGGDNDCYLNKPVDRDDPVSDYCQDDGNWDCMVMCIEP